jgi:hypothetical protein
MKRIIEISSLGNCVISTLTLVKFLSLLIPLALLVSCATVKPQVDIHHNQIGFDSVALRVIAPALKVRNITEVEQSYAAGLIVLSPLIGMLAVGIEHATNLSKDKATADTYNENLTKSYITDYLGQSFINQIRKSYVFPISLSGQNKDKQLIKEGYDALVVIEIEEISLLKELLSYSSKLSLHVRANATMTNLRKEGNIWTKSETITSNSAYTFEEYKADNSSLLLKELNTLLDKLSFRLSSYLIYSE